MTKAKITVATLGHMPANFNGQKIKKWKSSIFEVVGGIQNYSITGKSDVDGWIFSDSKLNALLPRKIEGDFIVAIVNVPIELNWYTRRPAPNRIIFTFHEIRDILDFYNIPLENIVMRVLYLYSLVYRAKNGIPSNDETYNYTHDDTRGCLFDMNGYKGDIIHSCHKPIICPSCVEKLKGERVSANAISDAQREIRQIKKIYYYRIIDFIQSHPILSLIITAFATITLGTVSSIIASYMYDFLKAVH
jgi:hypothetical protein